MTIGPQKLFVLDHKSAIVPQVYRWLRRAIIHAELVPGSRLSETDIAAHMATSRQPVREAFIKLVEDGLVEVRPQRGTYVRKISVGAVMDARFIREAIEAEIVRELACKSDLCLVRDLQRQIQIQRSIAGLEPSSFFQLDEEFHRTLAEGAGHVHAWTVIEGLRSHLDRVRHLATRKLSVATMIEQHAAVVEAISRGDVPEADRAIRGHLRTILTELPLIVRDCALFFDGDVEA